MEAQRTTKYCSNCGQIIDYKAEICPKCGVRVAPPPLSLGDGRNKIVAGILAILLGGFGAHKFYLGKIGLGILYLLFFLDSYSGYCWYYRRSIISGHV